MQPRRKRSWENKITESLADINMEQRKFLKAALATRKRLGTTQAAFGKLLSDDAFIELLCSEGFVTAPMLLRIESSATFPTSRAMKAR